MGVNGTANNADGTGKRAVGMRTPNAIGLT